MEHKFIKQRFFCILLALCCGFSAFVPYSPEIQAAPASLPSMMKQLKAGNYKKASPKSK